MRAMSASRVVFDNAPAPDCAPASGEIEAAVKRMSRAGAAAMASRFKVIQAGYLLGNNYKS
jgi:hypothetical protein